MKYWPLILGASILSFGLTYETAELLPMSMHLVRSAGNQAECSAFRNGMRMDEAIRQVRIVEPMNLTIMRSSQSDAMIFSRMGAETSCRLEFDKNSKLLIRSSVIGGGAHATN